KRLLVWDRSSCWPILDVCIVPVIAHLVPPFFFARRTIRSIERFYVRLQLLPNCGSDECAQSFRRNVPLQSLIHIFIHGDVQSNRHEFSFLFQNPVFYTGYLRIADMQGVIIQLTFTILVRRWTLRSAITALSRQRRFATYTVSCLP